MFLKRVGVGWGGGGGEYLCRQLACADLKKPIFIIKKKSLKKPIIAYLFWTLADVTSFSLLCHSRCASRVLRIPVQG